MKKNLDWIEKSFLAEIHRTKNIDKIKTLFLLSPYDPKELGARKKP